MLQNKFSRNMSFEKFLGHTANITSNRIPYYIGWIKHFEKYFSKHRLEEKEAFDPFLVDLQKQFEGWQVAQAKEAVKLHWYYTGFSKSLLETENNLTYRISQFSFSAKEWGKATLKMREILRLQHKSYRTEKTYLAWIRRFYLFLKYKDPAGITQEDLKQYLSYLAVDRKVSASTQQQAFNALLFPFRYVLDKQIEGIAEAIRSRVRKRLPVVLDQDEIVQIFQNLQDPFRLLSRLIYGGGLRLNECLSLRIKDLNFKESLLTVRSGKGDKDRVTLLPSSLHPDLINHLKSVRVLYDADRRNFVAGVPLPTALERKYPGAGTEWAR